MSSPERSNTNTPFDPNTSGNNSQNPSHTAPTPSQSQNDQGYQSVARYFGSLPVGMPSANPPGYFAPPPGLERSSPADENHQRAYPYPPPQPVYSGHPGYQHAYMGHPSPSLTPSHHNTSHALLRPRPRPVPRPVPSFQVTDRFGELNDHNTPSQYRLRPAPRELTPEKDELPEDPMPTARKRPATEDDTKPAKRPTKAKPKEDADTKKKSSAKSKSDPKSKARAQPAIKKPSKKVEIEEDEDDNVKGKGKGGRTVGASEYGNSELQRVVDLVTEHRPVGGKAWDVVTREYNDWARESGYPERERKPLQTRFNKLVAVAKEKPTGDAERLEIYEDALTAEELINERVGLGDIQDDDEDEVMEISSSSESCSEEESNHEKKKSKSKGMGKEQEQGKVKDKGKGKKKEPTVLTKSYKVEAPLSSISRPSRTSRQNQASEILGNISASLNPHSMQQRDDNRAAANFQLLQLQHLQGQLTDMTRRIESLSQRALQAESELKMYKLLNGRSYSRSPRRRNYYSPSHSRSRSRSPRRHWHDHSWSPSYSSHRHGYNQSRSRSSRWHQRTYSQRRSHSRSPFGSPRYRRHRQSPPSSQQEDPHHLRSISPTPFINTDSTSPQFESAATEGIIQRSVTPPVVASSSRVTLEQLADLAIGSLDPGDVVTVKPRKDGDYDVEVSPSKKKH